MGGGRTESSSGAAAAVLAHGGGGGGKSQAPWVFTTECHPVVILVTGEAEAPPPRSLFFCGGKSLLVFRYLDYGERPHLRVGYPNSGPVSTPSPLCSTSTTI